TPSSKPRLLFYKALYSNGFNRFAYLCFLIIFFLKSSLYFFREILQQQTKQTGYAGLKIFLLIGYIWNSIND
ncbi:MAG: hypothetical protein DI548_06530, partial [Flavobacterium johnsoniae]